MQNQFICPNEGCIQHTDPTYFASAEIDVECGSCGAHGATIEVEA